MQAAIEQRILHETRWLGVPAQKNPMDAWVYQEIIHEQRPDVIVEIGNHRGGSLLFLATICDLVGHGRVIGVDIDHASIHPAVFQHSRIGLALNDAIQAFFWIASAVQDDSVLVIEDSSHDHDHTLAVLRTYGQLVKPGGYMICEDGVMPDVARALETFAGEQNEFIADPSREWPTTWNPGGYLRRVK